MQVFKVNESGYYVEPVILKISEEIPFNCVDIQPPQGLYRAKWTGTEWVEDMAQEEINTLNNVPKEPSIEDYMLDLDFRLSMIELG